MDFTLSDEQALLRDSARRFVDKDYPFEGRRARLAASEGFSRKTWATFAELGWLALGIPESMGGLGGGAVETAVLMEAFGRGLVVEPYLATMVLGAGLIVDGGSAEQRAALLPAVVEGRLLLALAHAERQARYDLADVATTARRDGGGFVLDGRKIAILGGDSADRLLVSARIAGDRRDRSGVSLFLVAPDASGLGRRGYATVDGLRAAEVTLDGVRVAGDAVVGAPGGGLVLIERAVERGIAAVAAEAVGIMGFLREATQAYLKTRRQFGRPIGDFQVLQHRLVDMYMAEEQSRSMAYMAAVRMASSDPLERARAVSAAKVQIGRAGRLLGQQAVQLHGAIAMTDEFAVGHYFKRLTMIDTLFGDADVHLARFARL